MNRSLIALVFCTLTTGCWAIGFSEDPGELVKRDFNLFPFTHLSLRGEVTAEIRKGDRYSVTVRTTRALFDQLSVFSFFGNAWLAVETGLRGPREVGPVEISITVPRLGSLTVLDNSTAMVEWPSEAAHLKLQDASFVDLKFNGTVLFIEGNYRSTYVISGSAESLKVYLRNGSRVDARNLSSKKANLDLNEASRLQLGPTGSWEGTLSHGSTTEVSTPPPEGNVRRL